MVILRNRSQGFVVGKQIELIFQIKLHKKDKNLLELIQKFFGGVGRIEEKGPEALAFVVSSLQDITLKILPHFDNHCLKTQKQADYLLWRQVATIMGCNCHRTNEGLQTIVNLRTSINWGLTDKLKSEYPDIVPAKRPNIVNKPALTNSSIADSEWVAGFTSGEGFLR